MLCDFQGSGAAQNRLGGKMKRLFNSIAYRLSNNCTKNYYNRANYAQINSVTCFFETQNARTWTKKSSDP